MDRGDMDKSTASAPSSFLNPTDFGIHDFINEPDHLQRFIELIRGETTDSIGKFCPNTYDCDHVNACWDDTAQFGSTAAGDLFQFNAAVATSNPDSVIDSLLSFDEETKGGGEKMEEEEEEEEEGSSGNTPTKKTGKVDRSRTLISERRRRVRMKEKLYALRSLVPNITKMDKASIVGDAVLYVQQLQMQAKKLKAEIAGLQSSMVLGGERYNNGGLVGIPKKLQAERTAHSPSPICGKILQMDVFKVEERGFYAKVVSNKGERVAVSLYKALESLSYTFNIHNSNLSTLYDTFVLTFTLNNATEYEEHTNLPNLKLWLTGALLKQGFGFECPTTTSP